jgi:hypothetical protein
MYIPEPLFVLVLAYVTDGQPARRVLTHFDRARPVRGWQLAWGPAWAGGLLNRPGRDWGAVRRLIDTAVHLYIKRGWAGWKDAHSFMVACMPRDTNRALRCMLGTWPAPPGVDQPRQLPVPDPFQKLIYNYGNCDEVQVVICDFDVADIAARRDPDNTTVFVMNECCTRGCRLLPPCTTFII